MTCTNVQIKLIKTAAILIADTIARSCCEIEDVVETMDGIVRNAEIPICVVSVVSHIYYRKPRENG